MPVQLCSKDGQTGYKWGGSGVCYVGPGAKDKAAAVGRAITADKSMDEKLEKAEVTLKQKLLGVLEQWKHNILHSEPPFEETDTAPAASSFAPDLTIAHKEAPVLKALDEDKRLVTGVVLQPEIVDAQGDVISKEEIEETAYEFLAKHRTIGKQHNEKADAVVVESFLAKSDMQLGGELVVEGTWVMTVKVLDEALWEDAKAGKFTGFSIGGYADVEELE